MVGGVGLWVRPEHPAVKGPLLRNATKHYLGSGVDS